MDKKILVIILSITWASLFSFAKAQETPAAEGITISPPLFELDLNKEKTSSYRIKVTNTTDNPLVLYASSADFEAAGEGGQPSFSEDNEQHSKYSMAKWISFDNSEIVLDANDESIFTFNITPPSNAEPGGHYGAVFLTTKPPESKGAASQVALSSRIGSLMLVRIPGEINEEGSLQEFSAKGFYFSPPVNFTSLLKNNGNIHFKPEGDILIKGLFGSESARLYFNPGKGNVLPGSHRRFEIKWDPETKPFWKIPIGRYSAELRLSYGQSQKTIGDKINFWIIPWWIIITISIIISAMLIMYTGNKIKNSKKSDTVK